MIIILIKKSIFGNCLGEGEAELIEYFTNLRLRGYKNHIGI